MLLPILMRRGVLPLRRAASLLYTRRFESRSTAHCDAHMNELPVPCGPWKYYWKDQQSFYNKVLLAGTLWFFFSLFLMIYTGSFFLNWGPPAQPAPPSEVVEQCAD